METLLYFGKVNIYWILFYACYWLFFRKHTFFVWNRAYLIGSLLISFLLPVISIPETEQATPTLFYSVSAVTEVPFSATTEIYAPKTFDWIEWVWLFAAIGSFFMLKKLFKSFWDLRQIISQGDLIQQPDFNLILLSDNKTGSFSFLKWLVLNRYDYENNPDPILRHEMVHIQQRHSLDILLIEIIKVVFWFNPVIWFYKVSLQEVHEFLADEAAPNRDHYARFLVSYSLAVPVTLLTNHFFNSSTLKSRIKMIYKNRNSRWSLGKYLMIVPVLLFAVLITAARKKLTLPEEVKTPATTRSYNEIEIEENIAQPTELTRTTSKSDTGKVKIDIEGDILRESGLGIANVNIVDPETNISVTTDPLGHFKMANTSVGRVLTVSHVSYIPQILVVEKGKTKYILTFKTGQNEIQGPEFIAFQDIAKINAERQKEKEAAESLSFVKEQKPQFPGGEEALSRYIESNIRYPIEALRTSIGGIALVTFIIDRSGEIRKPKVMKEIGWGIDEEAVRLVLNMPRWEPARQNGRPVSMEYTLSIHFNLKREVANKEKYQGSYPADTKKSYYRYFNYKMPETNALAKQDKLVTKAFDFADDKKPEVKVPAIQLRIYKPAHKQD
ncbi:energy transducer TonB [Dyadobacter sp. 3J3]|uniref:energy transducer TonB n=1 Tax=Dyadobacter sp. 3J3 TaxID=2606600 RepID=UPI00135CDDAB|nr:energy transducer TonB [Dyadobacter sp. 3J3]